MFWKKISINDLIIVIILSLIYAIPVISTNIPYIDDLGRSRWGYSGWENNGRPLAALIFRFISLWNPLQNLYPLPQVLGTVATGLSGLILFKAICFREEKLSVYCGSLSILINPFYLENLSYNYDCLTMGLSILILTVPYLFIEKAQANLISLVKWFLINSICIIASLSLYQISANLSFGFILIYFLSRILICQDKSEIKFLLSFIFFFVIDFVFSYLIYQTLIADTMVAGEYSMKHSETLPISSFFIEFWNNSIGLFKFILSALNGISQFILYPLLFTSVCVVFSGAYRTLRTSASGVLASIIVLLIPVIFIFLSFGIVSVMRFPLFNPRVFIGFSGFIFMGMYAAILMFGRNKYLQFLLVVPVFACFILNISYANALQFQEKYDNAMYTSIARALMSLGFKKNDTLLLQGIQQEAAQTKLAASKFTIISSLVPKYIDNNWYWGYVRLKDFGIIANILSEEEYKKVLELSSCVEPIISSSYSSACKVEPAIFLVKMK
ncbi:MAG: glucosyltransferase domain-containing protein [Bacteroidia bacterium]